ncbi:MAG TPA: long-chain fatty acid--CoA ligase, partial [Micrococcaceae bacterium]|nr:long-chain fatty acid--CoA ligase [Micrococcaceae bacterium]
MPFLDRLQHWAREQPDRTAVRVGGAELSFAELVESATAMLPEAGSVTTLCQPNSVELVARFAAAVAGERRCAVLDPTWPAAQRHAVDQQLQAFGTPAEGLPQPSLTTLLEDGRAESPFLIGLTSGTSAVPKGFSRSRISWQRSFDRSIAYFGLARQDVTLAPGPLSASLNLYAL